MSWTVPKERRVLLDQLMLLAGGNVEYVRNALRCGPDLRAIIRCILEQRKANEATHD